MDNRCGPCRGDWSSTRVVPRSAFKITLVVTLCGSVFAQAQKPAAASKPPDKIEGIVDEAVENLMNQMDRHWHRGEYRHVINICKVMSAARPDMTDAYINAGWLLWS